MINVHFSEYISIQFFLLLHQSMLNEAYIYEKLVTQFNNNLVVESALLMKKRVILELRSIK